MATIIKEVRLRARPEAVWAAFRKVGEVHDVLARGFVTDTQMDGEDRIVTFANGVVARERIISLDEERRRLAYSAESGRLSHHNASFQVFADGADGARVVWITDILPNEMADTVGAMIEAGVAAMRQTLES
jgi:Polyketide cyclase / dehydrase and lipid transport